MFRALRNYNYKLFWLGQAVSLPGSWMQTIGLAWLVLKLTNRADLLGLVTMFQFLPILLFALVGGVVADRVPKRKFLLLTQSLALLQALVLAILVSHGWIRMWEIYALSILGGLNTAFDNPTRQAFVVEMVGREDVANAVALNSGLFNAARILGPAIGGWIIASRIGIAGTFYLNALSFVAALIALSLMNPRAFHAVGAPARGKMLGQVIEAWRYCFSQPGTVLIIVLMGVIGVFGYNFTVVLPLLAKFALRMGPQGLGYLTAAMGVGSLGGAFYLARQKFPSRRLLLLGAGAFSVFLGLTALSGIFTLTCALLLLVGFSSILCNATGNTLLQMDTPDELRGRVMSIFFLLLAGSTPIGGFITGEFARYYQIRPTLEMEAIVCAAGVAWGVYYYSSRRLSLKDREVAPTRLKGSPRTPPAQATDGPGIDEPDAVPSDEEATIATRT